jgi:flagellar FliL protein
VVKLVKALIILLLLGGGGAAGWLYYTGYFNSQEGNTETAENAGHTEDGSHEQEAEQIYLPLEPPFVVNFTHRGTLRYLQVSLELMYTEQTVIDEINARMPAVRNALILLFSNQSYESISTYEGKEQLRHAILLAVNEVIGLEQPANSEESGQAYFTNFVMQ